MIIGLLNQKDGAGKTTFAINIAASFAREDTRVLLVDYDHVVNSCSVSA